MLQADTGVVDCRGYDERLADSFRLGLKMHLLQSCDLARHFDSHSF